jgi:alkyl hydroperoxide reductase subunit F
VTGGGPLTGDLAEQIRCHLGLLVHPVELVAALDDSPRSAEVAALLAALADLSPLVTVRHDGDADRRPTFTVRRAGGGPELSFAGAPLGHELASLVLALVHVGGHPPRLDEATAARIAALAGGGRFETWYSQSCHLCPDVVQALGVLAVLHPGVSHVAVDGAAFPEEAARRGVLGVPTVFRDGEVFSTGRLELADVLDRLGVAEAAEAPRDTFDVLVVGGGPAGAAAAVYAARKGVRTGLVAERFGGQVADTVGIENFVSVQRTEGPRLTADLEAHVRAYDVDVLLRRRAVALAPGGDGRPAAVTLEDGTELTARTVVLAPGARWRTLGVPGEEEYRNRGVTFCPHCDGPVFAGRRVAVVGGGNSGVEAAIDLAGIAAHVTVLEYAPELRADAVLLAELGRLANVTVHCDAETTAVNGDGERVTGLAWRDRCDGREHTLAVDGVFVQVGLVPRTDWLAGTVALTPGGEIAVDARGATSVAGVYAAGDATDVPYKQIVVAAGAGATAALGAFDHLIRTRGAPAPAPA